MGEIPATSAGADDARDLFLGRQGLAGGDVDGAGQAAVDDVGLRYDLTVLEGLDLPSAIRLNASSRYLSILLGPAVGGGLMLWLGPSHGLLTNVLIYLPFTALLMRFPYTGHAALGAGKKGTAFKLADIRSVFAAVSHEPRIMTMVAVAAATVAMVRVAGIAANLLLRHRPCPR